MRSFKCFWTYDGACSSLGSRWSFAIGRTLKFNRKIFFNFPRSWLFDIDIWKAVLGGSFAGRKRHGVCWVFLLSAIALMCNQFLLCGDPQWGAADAEIKVPSGENTELKRSPFQAWSRSVYSHTCYAYCQGFLSCLFLHFRSIHLHFFPKPLPNFPCVGCG